MTAAEHGAVPGGVSGAPTGAPTGAGVAGLDMYGFAELQQGYEAYWAEVHRRVPWTPATLTWHDDVHASWTAPELVVGWTCGWPLVSRLVEHVQVVGAFEFDIPECVGATYRSVIVVRRDLAGDGADLGVIDPAWSAAVNSDESLSGWVSLLHAVHGPGATWLGPVVWTGAHVRSLEVLAAGGADLASIDSVTWALVQRLRPELASAVRPVGHGPQVPCLPVVASPDMAADRLAELQRAMVDAVGEPALRDAMRTLLIRRFVPLTLADYLPLHDLAPAG